MATESFFSNASLAYLASAGAGKDGKTYSIKPTDGSGDFTFSRGSNLAATRVGPTGLIEKGRENLFKQSNTFDTTWLTSITLTSNQSGYDGSNDAWLLTKTASGFQSLYQVLTETGVMTMSVYAKAGSTNWMRLTQGGATAYFDLQNGVIGATSNGIDQTITSVGNGWFRCTLTANKTTSGQTPIYPVTAEGDASGSTDSIYIQDAQFELGLAATDYIESGATTGKAGLLEDEPRFDYSGGATCPSLLLEPSRTNLVKQSEYFGVDWIQDNLSIITNDATSPEGLQNATKVYPTSSGNYRNIRLSPSQPSSEQITMSIFAKAAELDHLVLIDYDGSGVGIDFNLSTGVATANATTDFDFVDMVDYGNGWYRCIATATNPYFYWILSDNGGLSVTANGTDGLYIYGAQAEQGSYPTSYIPTYGVSQTRLGDVLGNSNNISGLFNDNKGTLYLETDDTIFKGEINNYNFFGLTESSSGSYFRFRGSNSTILAQSGGFGSTISFNPNGATFTKYLYKWDGTNIKIFIDGVERGSVSQTATFNPDLFRIGFNFGFVSNTKQLLVFPTALSDSECIELTTV